MFIDVLSQILAVAGISSSQEEFIFTTFNKLFVSPQPKKDLEVSLDSSFLSTKDINESCTKSDGEHRVEPEIKELSPFPSASLVCIPKTNYPSFPGMTEEGFQSGSNEEMNQYHQDYIEHWFQVIIQSKYHSHLQILLVPYQLKQLVSHTLVCVEIYSFKLSVSIFSMILRTWLHWKYSYT